MTRTDGLDVRGRDGRTDSHRRRTVAGDRGDSTLVVTLGVALAALGALAATLWTALATPGVATATPPAVSDPTLAATGATGATGAAVGALAWSRTRRRAHADRSERGRTADPAVLSLLAEPYVTVEDAERRLAALERRFRESGDRRAVFLTVYAGVTRAVADAIERDAFEDPQWVADYLVTFADFYRRAAFAHETGRLASVPSAWRLAFRAAEREQALVLQHAALGVNAHVTFDLAFALFAVGVGEDGDRRARYADHRRINRVLWRLVDVTLDRLAERYDPVIRVLDGPVGPLLGRLWFGALVVGREVAWWVAVAMTQSRSALASRAPRLLLAAVSTVVASLLVSPTALLLAARVLQSAVGTAAGRAPGPSNSTPGSDDAALGANGSGPAEPLHPSHSLESLTAPGQSGPGPRSGPSPPVSPIPSSLSTRSTPANSNRAPPSSDRPPSDPRETRHPCPRATWSTMERPSPLLAGSVE
jgi:hypothetical protein